MAVNDVGGLVFGPGFSSKAYTVSLGALAGSGSVNLASVDSPPVPLLISAGGNNASTIFSGSLTGSGSFTKTGTGALTLTGSSNNTGGINLTGGTLDIDSPAALGNGPFTITGGSIGNSSGAALTLSTTGAEYWKFPFEFLGPYDLNLGTGNIILAQSLTRYVYVLSNNLTVGGVISGSVESLVKAGTGTLTLDGSNTYSGGTTLSAGQLNVNNPLALGGGTVAISGGTLGNTSGTAVTLSTTAADKWSGDFAFAGTNDLNLGAGAVTLSGTRTVTVLSNNLTVGGAIGDGGHAYSLTKVGAGTLVLAGSDSYTGGTRVSDGTLEFAAPLAIPTKSILTIQSGGEVVLGDLAGAARRPMPSASRPWRISPPTASAPTPPAAIATPSAAAARAVSPRCWRGYGLPRRRVAVSPSDRLLRHLRPRCPSRPPWRCWPWAWLG